MASRTALGLSFCAGATALDRRTPAVRRTANRPSEMLMISLQSQVPMGRCKQERALRNARLRGGVGVRGHGTVPPGGGLIFFLTATPIGDLFANGSGVLYPVREP